MYGIDLGTTNTVAFKHYPEMEGMQRLTPLIPSVVNKTLGTVGAVAREQIVQNHDDNIVASFKVDINLGYAIEASAEVLRHVKETVGLNEEVVISVPAYFTSLQRKATLEAAARAGLTVRSLINEPTAAAMFYNQSNKKITLVYDLGGGTFDISIVDSRFGRYDVQATDGIKLGGDDLDVTISKAILNKCKFLQHRVNYDDVALVLKRIAEDAKIKIQNTGETVRLDLVSYGVEDYFEKKIFELTLDEYKLALKMVFGKTINRTLRVIEESTYSKDELSLIFVGGSTRDPHLKKMIEDGIGIIAEPMTYNPDTIVAEGAAFYATMLAQGVVDGNITDVTSAVGFMLSDGTVYNVVPKNSCLPLKVSHIVTNDKKSDGVQLSVYQGDSVIADDNTFLGELIYKFEDGEREAGEAVLTVYFEINNEGVLTVSAKELGRSVQKVELKL